VSAGRCEEQVSVPGVGPELGRFSDYLNAEARSMGHPSQGVAAERGNDVSTATATGALTAADRCDRCGAQAYVRATLESGFDLLFCAHHFHENAARLREVAVRIHDESDRLAAIPATAALEER
jgi:hypothetical protein